MPNVALYCQDFLKPDMQHVYRQVESLQRWKPFILTQKREHAGRFPFPEKRMHIFGKPSWRFVRRAWQKHVVKRPPTIGTGRVIEIMTHALRFETELVHIFFGNIGIQLLPFIKASPLPVVVSFHGADAGVDVERPSHRSALLGVFDHARLILARSESLAAQLIALGCPQEKVRLQRTGIPLHDWPFHPRPWPENGDWRFVQSCRLVPKKGLRCSLAAFREFARTFPHATFTIAGDGPMKTELETLIKEWNLEGKVFLSGFLEQSALRTLLDQAHLFLHPSQTPADGNREGVPNSMLEAMASGLPVLGTRHGGIPEALTHGQGGMLVEEGDAAALAEAALRVTASEEVYRALAQGARRAVEEKFERVRQTEVLESIYDEASRKCV